MHVGYTCNTSELHATSVVQPWSLGVRRLRHDERCLARVAFQLVCSKPYLAALYRYLYVDIRLLSRLGRNIAHVVNCQVFLPPFYPRAVHVISHTKLSSLLFYYIRSLYVRRGEPEGKDNLVQQWPSHMKIIN